MILDQNFVLLHGENEVQSTDSLLLELYCLVKRHEPRSDVVAGRRRVWSRPARGPTRDQAVARD